MVRKGWLQATAIVLIASGALVACTKNPVTGRSQLMLVGEAQGVQMGTQAYQEIKGKEKTLSANDPFTKRVRAITERLIQANNLPNYDWEVNAFQNDEPNAFALPGGKVGVNTGMGKVAKNDAQLAAVIGHEIAHAISHHGEERISQQMAVSTGLQLGSAALGLSGMGNSEQMTELMGQAATLGIILPYSRTHESEADEIGLYYMARAGYDPREAVKLWENMSVMGGEKPPEFLSTHPADATRINDLNAEMPKALEYYRAAVGK
ncbi:M48 family metallopeptidase [Rhodospirillum sp. A1_3_36]|uniref:M48 family metallopeptidase n=1 Tax=Rhodospirillum sp. A1_3_36 TaxID=3391666 RepID=UPI0039A581B5